MSAEETGAGQKKPTLSPKPALPPKPASMKGAPASLSATTTPPLEAAPFTPPEKEAELQNLEGWLNWAANNPDSATKDAQQANLANRLESIATDGKIKYILPEILLMQSNGKTWLDIAKEEKHEAALESLANAAFDPNDPVKSAGKILDTIDIQDIEAYTKITTRPVLEWLEKADSTKDKTKILAILHQEHREGDTSWRQLAKDDDNALTTLTNAAFDLNDPVKSAGEILENIVDLKANGYDIKRDAAPVLQFIPDATPEQLKQLLDQKIDVTDEWDDDSHKQISWLNIAQEVMDFKAESFLNLASQLLNALAKSPKYEELRGDSVTEISASAPIVDTETTQDLTRHDRISQRSASPPNTTTAKEPTVEEIALAEAKSVWMTHDKAEKYLRAAMDTDIKLIQLLSEYAKFQSQKSATELSSYWKAHEHGVTEIAIAEENLILSQPFLDLKNEQSSKDKSKTPLTELYDAVAQYDLDKALLKTASEKSPELYEEIYEKLLTTAARLNRALADAKTQQALQEQTKTPTSPGSRDTGDSVALKPPELSSISGNIRNPGTPWYENPELLALAQRVVQENTFGPTPPIRSSGISMDSQGLGGESSTDDPSPSHDALVQRLTKLLVLGSSFPSTEDTTAVTQDNLGAEVVKIQTQLEKKGKFINDTVSILEDFKKADKGTQKLLAGLQAPDTCLSLAHLAALHQDDDCLKQIKALLPKAFEIYLFKEDGIRLPINNSNSFTLTHGATPESLATNVAIAHPKTIDPLIKLLANADKIISQNQDFQSQEVYKRKSGMFSSLGNFLRRNNGAAATTKPGKKARGAAPQVP